MKPRKDKTARLQNTAEVGHRLARFVDDPLIAEVVEDMEESAIEAMITATSVADREREALRIQVIRAFWAEIKSKASQAPRAVAQLNKAESVTHA